MRYLITIIFLGCIRVFGQAPEVKLPTIIPPSPEVAQLNKVGALSAGLHTGSANVSIPLYSFSVNSAQVNVGLSYNSNGIKVDDIPSRVGLGWNLVAAGVVSRVIHDEPDGDYAYYPPPGNLYDKNQAMLDYLQAASLPSYDTEWDEYSYSFNGMSGKFFLDASGEGHCIPHNNLKVKVNGHNTSSKWISITTAEGIKYEFGVTTKEKTRSLDIGGGSNAGRVTKMAAYETAWFLEKIITPQGDIIYFNYAPVYIKTIQSPYQTMIKPYSQSSVCNGTPCSYSEQTGLNAIEYDTYYLTNINTEGITVNFYYEARSDGSGDKRLINLGVTATGSVTANKWFKFSYTDPSVNNTSLNKRFFLTKLSENQIGTGNGIDLSSGNWLSHDFEYTDVNGMPSRLSYSQDWYGYYNGVNNNYFSPYIASIASSVVNGSMGADRNPGTLEQMQKGLLKKVTFPSGANQQFIYEPHTLLQYTTSLTSSNTSTNGSGTGTMNPWVHNSQSFTANSDQTASLSLSCYKSPAFPDAPSGEGDKIYELKLKEYGTGNVVFYRKYYYYTSEIFNVSLVNNTTYYLELTVYGEVNAGSADIHYNPSTVTTYENKIVGGVRVKEISSFDPLAIKTFKKYYTYAALSDLSKSSGVGILSPDMYANYKTGTLCNPGTLMAYMGVCDNYMISSNGLFPYPTFGGSPFAYQNVIESDDADFANGFTEHFFKTNLPSTIAYNILGNSPLGTPANITTDYNGLEYETKVYKKSGTANILVKEVLNNYDDGGISNSKTSYMVRQRWQDNQHWTPPAESEFDGYDLMQYYYNSSWFNLKSTVTTEYDQNGQNPLTTTVSYTYSNLTHLQPTQIENTTSFTSKPKKVQNKYPIDFISSVPTAPNVYDAMVGKNIITPVIEQKIFSGETLLSEVKNNYAFWLPDNNLIAPLSMEVGLKGNTKEARISYNSYSSKGNILEQQKINDVKRSYIWGYLPQKPTTEVINAGSADIAFSSFEPDEGSGNWTINSTQRDGSTSITGKACYNLSNGSISKATDAAKKYILSYWTKNLTALAIAGTEGTTIGETTVSGWKYFEHKISGQSNILLYGTGLIDELRLYPEGAQMVTYTYEPLIGIASQCDANNQISNFEYDGFNRLIHVRDRNKNILKKFQYKYGEVLPCTNTTANWQATGVLRCIKDANNNNTGEQQKEENDINNCSSTYLQTRWVSLGTNSTICPVVPNCTGPDKRVVNGVCETGVMVITQQQGSGSSMTCTFHYEWSDGYWSQNYQTSGSGNCLIEM